MPGASWARTRLPRPNFSDPETAGVGNQRAPWVCLLAMFGAEERWRSYVEPFAHQAFGLLRRTSFRDADVATAKLIAVEVLQGRSGCFRVAIVT